MAHYDSAPAMGGDYVPLRPSGGPDVELLDNDEDFPGGDPLNAWRATPHHPGASTGWSASALWRSLWPHNGAVSPQGRGWQRPQLSVLEVLLAVITALLAAAVLLLSSDVRVSKALAAAQLRHWEGISPAAPQPPTSPPAKPPPPSPPASSATAPVSAWVAHLQAAGYVPYVSSFVTLWVDSAHADLLLQFPHSAHNRLILLNAEVSAADADTYLLHQPLGGVRGQASDITIEAEEILKMRARLIKEIADETGQPYEKVVNDTERNFWMGAEDAQKYGLVSKIVTTASDV